MIRFAFGECGLAVILASTSWAQVTQRMSVDSAGAQGNHASYFASLSVDGRWVAFVSEASNLVPGDTNATQDVFVRDRQSGLTDRVSVATDGTQGNAESGVYGLAISADGRYVAFASDAYNLVTADTNASTDIFVRDRQIGRTERVSLSSAGTQAHGASGWNAVSISADGRYVVFTSAASDLVPGDTNGQLDVFVRDRLNGTTERVSVSSAGVQGNVDSGRYGASISADGRFVAFESDATNLVAGDTNGFRDVFVRDLQGGTTERVSVTSSGVEADFISVGSSISADGRFVAFTSGASNLVPGDTNGQGDVFVRDRQSGTTECVSLSSIGGQGNESSGIPSISADGRFVAFESTASNLVLGDTNGSSDVFVHDRQKTMTTRVSTDSMGAQGDNASHSATMSSDGRIVAFSSLATNLVSSDTNGVHDVFVHDLAASGFASLCDPGVGGVAVCPCSNPPSGPGRGCDNSSSTGGASLSASGAAYLSMDSLVFTTNGEKPTAASVLLEGNNVQPLGIPFGQGVRCVGGLLKRMYVQDAVGGSVTMPNFGAGDLSVSTRAAQLGDIIQAGQSRWFLVYYRDTTVLGGCSSLSTYNATQTGQIVWSL